MHALEESRIQTKMTESVENVFKTMLSVDAVLKDCVLASKNKLEAQPHEMLKNGVVVAAGIGFAGNINGFSYVCALENVAKKITCKFLGFTPEEVEKEGIATVNDAMGELANMITGDFKNKLCDLGYPCMLSIPCIFNGQNPVFNNCKGGINQRYTFVYNVLDGACVLELFFKS